MTLEDAIKTIEGSKGLMETMLMSVGINKDFVNGEITAINFCLDVLNDVSKEEEDAED